MWLKAAMIIIGLVTLMAARLLAYVVADIATVSNPAIDSVSLGNYIFVLLVIIYAGTVASAYLFRSYLKESDS